MAARRDSLFKQLAEQAKKGHPMLWSIAVILAFVWALGLLTSHTVGGFVHLLLATAVVLVLVRAFQRRHPLQDWERRPK